MMFFALILVASTMGVECPQTNCQNSVSNSTLDAAQMAVTTTVSAAAATVTNCVPTAMAPAVTVPESGYEDINGVVKVSVFIDLKTERLRYPEGTAMLRAMKLLRKARPEIPPKYVVNGRVLLNSHNRTTGLYTYVVEYDPVTVAATIAKAKADMKAREDAKARALAEQKKLITVSSNAIVAASVKSPKSPKLATPSVTNAVLVKKTVVQKSVKDKKTVGPSPKKAAVEDSQSFLLEEDE